MSASAPPIAIEHLTKSFSGDVLAVDDLNLVIEEGQVFGLLGPNGAGKTTSLRALLGLVHPSSGRARLWGEPVHSGSPMLERVGTLVESPGFVPHLSGLDNLRLAWRLTRRPAGEAGLEPALDYAALGEALHRPYSTYSHGMHYRLGFAQALLGRPELLILDEPVTGLDPLHVRQLRAALAELVARGTTVLMSSHVLGDVQEACTHVAVMQQATLGELSERIGAEPSPGTFPQLRPGRHRLFRGLVCESRRQPQHSARLLQSQPATGAQPLRPRG